MPFGHSTILFLSPNTLANPHLYSASLYVPISENIRKVSTLPDIFVMAATFETDGVAAKGDNPMFPVDGRLG